MTAHTPTEAAAVAGRLRGLQSGAREIDDAPVTVQGELPGWLAGTLLLNGPALWDLPGGSYRHWFDGHAMLHRLAISPEGVRYRSRFLQTEDLRASIAAGKPAMGAFGTNSPDGFLQRMRTFGKPKATDNGAVVMARIGTQWVAQTETPYLTRFDPDTLETQGRYAFEDGEHMQLMSAHSHTDDDGTYWNLGVELGPKCTYKLFKLAPGSHRREVVARVTVRKPGYLHGFAMTPRHAVFWETAMRAQPLGFIFTGRSYIDNFRWEPAGGSRIHTVSRVDGSVRSWDVPAMMAFHAVQAWDHEDGSVVLDLSTTDDAEVFSALMLDRLRAGEPLDVPHTLRRYRLQPGQARAEPERLGGGFDLPQVHPQWWGKRRSHHAWGAGFDTSRRAPLFDRTVKIGLDSGTVTTFQRQGALHMEPLFVGRPQAQDEEDGVLLVPTLADSDEGTVVAVVDARSMQQVAELHAPQVVPFGFHAAWNS